MPFKSVAQRGYLWANHPEIARRWQKEGKGYVASDGENQEENNASGGGSRKMPPWMQKAQQAKPDDKKVARQAVIQKRLAKMSKKGK